MEPLAKRPKLQKSETPLNVLSSKDEPFDQGDVVYYQKEAIWRQWHLQASKNKRLSNSIENLQQRYNLVFSYYETLNQWWSQLISGLPEVENDGNNSNALVSVDNILTSLNCKDKDNLIIDEGIKLKMDKLRLQLQGKIQITDDISELNNTIASLNALKDSLLIENDSLKKIMGELNDQIDELIKKNDRYQSKTVNRIYSVKKEQVKQEESGTPTLETATDSNSVSMAENNNEAQTHQLEDFKIKISELNAKNDSLSTQLDSALSKITTLEIHIHELNNKSLNSLDSRNNESSTSTQTPTPQYLIEKNLELEKSVADLELTKKKISSQLFELESQFTSNSSKLQDKYKAELTSSNNIIAKLEADVTRIRSDRDTLQAKIAVLKAEKDKSELIDHYQKLTKTLEHRIIELESKPSVEQSSDEYSKMLAEELKQIEQAFKQTREVASAKLSSLAETDVQMTKLRAEKTKADEKYFQAMRSKDALSSQNKTLQANLTKQQELIDLYKAHESELKSKLSIEQSLYEKLQSIEDTYNKELITLRKSAADSESSLKLEQQKLSDLRSSMTSHTAEIGTLQKRISTLEESLSGSQARANKMESLVQKYRTNSRTEEDEEINQALLSMTKCSLCTKNFKDVVLKTCGHTFCQSCVDDRLNARMRKCPNCNSQFSRYDLLSIHL